MFLILWSKKPDKTKGLVDYFTYKERWCKMSCSFVQFPFKTTWHKDLISWVKADQKTNSNLYALILTFPYLALIKKEISPLVGVIENPILVLFKLRLPIFPVATSVSGWGQFQLELLLHPFLLDLALQLPCSPGLNPYLPLCRAKRWTSSSQEETAAWH